AGADRQSLDHGYANHPAIDDRPEVIASHTVLDHKSHIKTRTAHVSHDHVLVAERPGDVMSPHQARNRPAIKGAAGSSAEDFGDAARALDHQQGLAVAAVAQLVPHSRQLSLHRPVKVSVQNRRQSPFIFSELSHDLTGQYDRQVADVVFLVLVPDDFFDSLFVNRIEEAPQERHYESAHSPVDELTHFRANILLVQRPDHGPARINSFFEAQDSVARDQGLGLVLHGQIPALGNPGPINPLGTPSDQNSVFMAFGGQQSKARAFPFDQPIHRYGRRVPNYFDCGKQVI